MVYQNKVYGFLLQVPTTFLTLPQNFVSQNSSFIFQNSSFLDHPKSHHRDQNQQEFKIQINKVPLSVLIKCFVYPKSFTHPTPLTHVIMCTFSSKGSRSQCRLIFLGVINSHYSLKTLCPFLQKITDFIEMRFAQKP
jgi:hypothetical protein